MSADDTVIQPPVDAKFVLGFRSGSGQDWAEDEEGRPYRVVITDKGMAWAAYQDERGGYELLWDRFPTTAEERNWVLFQTVSALKHAAATGAAVAYNPDSGDDFAVDDMPAVGFDGEIFHVVPASQREELIERLKQSAQARCVPFVDASEEVPA